jgi:CRP/FNR family transcriptional regulator, cyclic AMP receptor protein
VKFIALLCQRVRWMSERMEEAVLLPLPVRLARWLCARAIDFGSDIHISQERLGIYVGAARETLNRQLQEWRREGILEMGRNRISLLKMKKLSLEARRE